MWDGECRGRLGDRGLGDSGASRGFLEGFGKGVQLRRMFIRIKEVTWEDSEVQGRLGALSGWCPGFEFGVGDVLRAWET